MSSQSMSAGYDLRQFTTAFATVGRRDGRGGHTKLNGHQEPAKTVRLARESPSLNIRLRPHISHTRQREIRHIESTDRLSDTITSRPIA